MFHRLLQVIEKTGTEIFPEPDSLGAPLAQEQDLGRVSNTTRIVPVRGKEGAHLLDGMGRADLPLRGKLGWMTPWFVTARPT
jgi:hypothetical protein